jgi:hypothetical protein
VAPPGNQAATENTHLIRQPRHGLRGERSPLSAMQKSAEGILGTTQATLVRHPKAERRGNREAEP